MRDDENDERDGSRLSILRIITCFFRPNVR